ncbi:MAG: type II toxin-antitoxin system Phd/YefM family antitoxin [Treponema sp.]|nr:type II toxin-antitoxin system Phd/YefM family antitoxin [Treponema sp.]
MMVETKQMIPITKLQKQLTQTVRNLSESGEAVYILKNNNMEAVLVSYQEYEHLKEIEDIFEHSEIKNIVDLRTKKYDPKKNVSWEKIR